MDRNPKGMEPRPAADRKGEGHNPWILKGGYRRRGGQAAGCQEKPSQGEALNKGLRGIHGALKRAIGGGISGEGHDLHKAFRG